MPPFFNFSCLRTCSCLQFYLLLILVFSSDFIAADELPVINNALAFSYDSVSLSSTERMGLVGGNYLFTLSNNLYTGLGIYGAAKGERGGFFTGGLALGWRQSIFKRYFIDLNAFAGGGGGGSAPQGGGLMLRTSVEAGLNVARNSFGLGYSYIEFPNGEISSHQVSFNYQYRFKSFHFTGWTKHASKNTKWLSKLRQHSMLRSSQFSLQLTRYFPQDSVARSGKQFDAQLDILGVRWRSKINQYLWLEFETGGAMLGNIDGYAQVFSGLSYDHYFTPRVYGSLGFLVGEAGGGDVNTDGGMVYRSFTGLGYRLNPQWSVKSEIAWTAALEGDFKAVTALFNIVYHYDSLIPQGHARNARPISSEKSIAWRQYRIRPGVQRYSHYRGSGRKTPTQKNIDVDLVNLKLDSFIAPKIYVTGQAIGAFTGKAGGYAVGLVGTGYQVNRYLSAEILGGVAGGGGIAAGSGQIIQPMVNVHLPLNERWGIEASLGYIRAVNGKLSAVASNLALSYHFRAPYL